MSEPISAFPPETIGAFLRCCAGEWMSLRSQFSLADSLDPADAAAQEPASLEEAWHSSERGELVVAFLEPEDNASVGGLLVAAGGKGPPRPVQ